MIYCVWYPSGGFGHFVNAVLTLHGENFARPKKQQYSFSNSGDSHQLELAAPKFFKNPNNYSFDFDSTLNYSVLIDNGINDESTLFVKYFPTACIVKICYSDHTWPIVAHTMIEKAMGMDISQVVSVGPEWANSGDWAIREKYFLFLRDNPLKQAWRIDSEYKYLKIDHLLCYDDFCKQLQSLGISTSDFKTLWDDWKISNQKYIRPIEAARQIMLDIKNKNYSDLLHTTDIWTQAIVYYYIWLEYNFEVPHNDYSEWFTNTKQIAIMLNEHGVNH